MNPRGACWIFQFYSNEGDSKYEQLKLSQLYEELWALEGQEAKKLPGEVLEAAVT